MSNLATAEEIKELIDFYRDNPKSPFTGEDLDKIEKVMIDSIGESDES